MLFVLEALLEIPVANQQFQGCAMFLSRSEYLKIHDFDLLEPMFCLLYVQSHDLMVWINFE
jgi:hypothetical protein